VTVRVVAASRRTLAAMALSDVLSDAELQFIRDNPSTAIITVGEDGLAKAVRIGVAVVDGRLWSSATATRARTRRLRRDPRCTLFVFDTTFFWLTLETTVTILDGPDVPEHTLGLMRTMQGKPDGPLSWYGRELDDDEFRQVMIEEQRVIHEFEVHRAYGMLTPP
jgi:hypothetical protein